MYSRLIFSIVLLTVAANQPCLAKAAHAQYGGRASATNNGVSGKGASGAKTPAAKPSVPIDAEKAIAPPVLPPRGPKPQPNRNANQNLKIVTPGNAAHSQAGGAIAPTVRSAIGQPIVQSKALAATQPHPAPTMPGPGAVPLPILRRAPPATAPAVSSNLAHSQAAAVNVTALANRGSINGAAVIRPSAAPAGIGGPVRPANGINGTAVQSKH
jgi:hypothetical protein